MQWNGWIQKNWPHRGVRAKFNPASAARYYYVIPAQYHPVIPAKAGIYASKGLDPRLRGDDGIKAGMTE